MAARRPEILLGLTIDAIGVTRLPRILDEAGYDVAAFCPSKLAVRRSLFVRRWVAGSRDPVEAARALRAHLEREPDRYAHVIAGDEPLLWAARELSGDWLQSWFPAPLSGPRAEVALSKIPFWRAAVELGVPMPESVLCSTPDELRAASARLGFPLLLKADYGLSGSGVRIVPGPATIEADFHALGGSRGILAQAFVDGQVGTTSALFDRGRPVCWFSAYTREQWPKRFNSSTLLEIADLPRMETILEAIGAATAFNGLCGLDWIEEPGTGRTLLLEMNPRPTPGLHLARRAGVDFALAIRDWLAGNSRLQRPDPAARGLRIAMFPQALYRAVDSRRPGLAWQAFADAPWRDPLLAGAHLRRVATHYLKSAIR